MELSKLTISENQRLPEGDLPPFGLEIVKPRNEFPIHLRNNNILKINCKMTVSNSLFLAVVHASFQKTRFLLDRGLSVNSRNDFGYNVLVASLHIDNDRKRDKMFAFLLREGADPSRRDHNHGRHALSWACVLGRNEQTTLLLTDYIGDIDLSEKDNDGLTALHHATHSGCIDSVKHLINAFQKFRMTVDVIDNQGMTPYIHARRLGFKDIAELLRYQGFASPSNFDSMTFRSPREWSQIGRFERTREEQHKRREERNRARIEGRVCSRYRNLNKEIGIDSFGMLNDRTDRFFVKRNVNHDLQPRETIDLQARGTMNFQQRDTMNLQQRETMSLPADFASKQSTPEFMRMKDTGEMGKRGSLSVAISLLDISGREHGRIANNFHHSQLDTSKVTEYSDMLGGIGTLMDILSQEQTTSFRKVVIPEPPPPEKVPVKVKSKVSSLAILFGKDRQRGKKSIRNRKSGKDSHDKRKRKVIGKSKGQLLPDIRVNDRAI